MKTIRFYVDRKGNCQVKNYITTFELQNDKNSKINLEKINSYLILLLEKGLGQIGYPYVRHIVGKIWELRPLNNRILFFEYNDAYIMLNAFKKDTKKTPIKEIKLAIRLMNDYIERNN